MVSFRILIVAICAFLLCFSSQKAFASGSGAYRVETPDAAAMGMGSAFVGEADTPAAVYYNPAGINQMTRPEVTVGDAIIAPRAQMTQSNGNVVHEQNNEFNVPNVYAVTPIIPNKLSIGIGTGSNWGLGTNWGYNGPLSYATTQANITDINSSLVASYQLTNQWSLAVSADNDSTKADESKNLPNLGYSADGNIQVKGSDNAWGYRIATMFKINDQNQVGLMYRSRINQTYSGEMTFSGIGPAYAAYGLGNSFMTSFQEKDVLPQSVVAGYSFKPTSKWTINADLEWMDWSSTKYQILSLPNANASELAFINAGGGTVTPENWHSALSESIGTQYDLTDSFRVRVGYYHHRTPISSVNFNPVLPDSSSNAFTTGFGYDITKRLTIDVTYSGLIYQTRDIINSLLSTIPPTGTYSANGKYSQYINIGLVSLTYKF